ncbi:MAG: ATP-dependent Clp protease ATP-binding subunit ClpA, partial [Desulfobulbaceae bacterium]|nr:ATP-dependent Clp protease ATP-binding subunit ClpA [Desulfobulbaceae bacterium]
MINQKVEMALVMAIREAKKRRHEHVTVEHILYGLLHDEMAVKIIEGCGGNRQNLLKDLESFFVLNLPVFDESAAADPVQTIGFNRVLQRAIAHVQSCGKAEVDSGDVITAIFAEQESFAVYFLEKEGLSKFDMVRYISHKLPSAPVALPRDGQKKEAEKPRTALEKFTVSF